MTAGGDTGDAREGLEAFHAGIRTTAPERCGRLILRGQNTCRRPAFGLNRCPIPADGSTTYR